MAGDDIHHRQESVVSTAPFTIRALPAHRLEAVRAAGQDVAGNQPRVWVNQEASGVPLRCCLRDAVPGEEVMVLAWSPFEVPGPYAEVGPVFAHAQACSGYASCHRYPAGWLDRDQVVRGYSKAGDMVTAQIAAPDHIEEVIADLLSRDDVETVHTRNVAQGCYMLAATRPE
jgi:hypothetical protein